MKKYTHVEMKEMMEVRGYSPNTVDIYISHVRNLAAYFNRPPHTLTPEHIHKYQVFLVQEKQVSWSTFNQSVCSMRFFLTMWLGMIGQSSIYHFRRSTKHSL
ncbi:MAG: phage integrase N-terminal SAM-like domain-containing protein [Labilibaculum sp.]|nr:phage integrase N-terminal SAM-like domain-containing protein [Labilibaculum sp.]